VVVNEMEGIINSGDDFPDLLAAGSGHRLHRKRYLAIPVADIGVPQVVDKP
jgi:hypothetical protein